MSDRQDEGASQPRTPEQAAARDLPEEAPVSATSVAPGILLATRRQELNLSITDVASRLNLAPRQVAAIENDNYGSLPGMAVARGFVRSYAKLVGLEAGPLLAALPGETVRPAEPAPLRRALPAKPFYQGRSPFAATRSFGAKSVIAISVLVLAAVALAAWKMNLLPESLRSSLTGWLPVTGIADGAEKNTDKADGQQETPDVTPESVGAASSPSAVPESAGDRFSAGPATDVNAAPVANQAPANTERQAAAVPVTPFVSGPAAGQHSQDQSGQDAAAESAPDKLVLKMREDSWIQIRDARRKTLVSRLAKAGETESVPAAGPLELTIGNATGVDAGLRGNPLKLDPDAKGNVARLTVK